jgi:hypothetical protein
MGAFGSNEPLWPEPRLSFLIPHNYNNMRDEKKEKNIDKYDY